MKKYGLQIRVQPSQQKKQPARSVIPPPTSFGDDDEDDVEREISRQATKNRMLKDIEEQQKKALEEDPSVFDYDAVYDEMKAETVRPQAQDRQERKPKYIAKLIEKAKTREREHEIIYERKLAKERSKEDHIYADKDKFVTSAYKKKLMEQAKWLEEERIRELREEKDDVTKKSDLSDFYFNLSKNVAFGSEAAASRKKEIKEEKVIAESSVKAGDTSTSSPSISHREKESHQSETSHKKNTETESFDARPGPDTSQKENTASEPSVADQPKHDHHKRSNDALAAAKERFLARKRAKEQ